MEWDVFISHASEDKDPFVRALAEGLRAEGVKVWYDDFTLKIGDSLRHSIDHGLSESRFGVVILSKNFFSKNWTMKELNGLFVREDASKKVILPIWLNITPKEVAHYSPILADRLAIKAEIGLENIVERLLDIIKSDTPFFENKKDAPSLSDKSTTGPVKDIKGKALIMKGGGVKGLAYAGAIKELEREYQFDWFVGTSAGAIAAVLLAAGFSVEELKSRLFEKDFRDFLDAKPHQMLWNFITSRGFYHAYTFTDWLDHLLAQKLKSFSRVKLKDLPKRVTVYACRRNQDALIFDSTDPKTQDMYAAYAVRCSMSIPFVFTPQMSEGMRVFDGGTRHNFPVEILLSDQQSLDFIGLYLGTEIYEGTSKPGSVIKDLISIWTEAVDTDVINKYREKIVIIDPNPIRTTDFSISDEEKNYLIFSGQVASQKYLKNTKWEDKELELENRKSRIIKIRQKRKRNKNIVVLLILFVLLILLAFINKFSFNSYPNVKELFTVFLTQAQTPIPTNNLPPTETGYTIVSEALQQVSQTSTIFTNYTPEVVEINTPTPNHPTQTPLPTPTIDPSNYKGLDQKCISTEYWRLGTVYESEAQPKNVDGCWDLDRWFIYPITGGLRVHIEDEKMNYNNVRAFYTEIPENVEISFNIRVDGMSTDNKIDAILFLGIGAKESFREEGRFVKIVVPAMLDYYLREVGDGLLTHYFWSRNEYYEGTTQAIKIIVKNLEYEVFADDLRLHWSSLAPDMQEVFWIGYQISANDGHLFAEITDLRIIPIE